MMEVKAINFFTKNQDNVKYSDARNNVDYAI